MTAADPAEPTDPTEPTALQPGSADKVYLMAQRFALGFPLFHRGDQGSDDRPLASPPAEFVRPTRPRLTGGTYRRGDRLSEQDRLTIQGQVRRLLNKLLRKCELLDLDPLEAIKEHRDNKSKRDKTAADLTEKPPPA